MSHKQHIDALGKPSIQLQGFQLWVHGREFPDATDYWDGNWLNVRAHCGTPGADVWVDGPILHLYELSRWVEACEQLNQTLTGEAVLDCLEPALHVELQVDRSGHITMRIDITPDHMTQEHRFTFEVDQTYLPPLITACRKVIANFPVRGRS